MGFRINRGIFQFKDTASDTFINKFKIADNGEMVEVDKDGNAVTAYMRVGDKATDADKLDGVNSSQFLRSDASDNVTGHTEWQDGYEVRLGNSADFRMQFNGSHTYFRNYNHGNGNIYFQGEDTAGANHALLYMFTANTRPYVSLYEDGGERFKTTSAGVEVLGDAYINQGRIHIKRGTGLTHAEWEDDSTANGRAQLILDSHYSDLIIASRNANSNKHGSTLTLATQSTSTNDVAKWVIGQGQYQEGAHIMAFAYGVNQTNPHSILGTDNAYAEMLITNGAGVWSRNGFSGDLSGNAATATTARDLGSSYTADDWFRATGDNNHIKFYGNSRQMMWRTDGVTEAYSGLGGYPFVWNYNGSGSGNRIMLLATDGRLWTGRYGWLDTAFDAAGEAQGVHTRIDEDIIPTITAAQSTADTAVGKADTAQADANKALQGLIAVGDAADAAQATADSKLGLTAKAADSNLLDGIDSGRFFRRIGAKNATAGAGWITVASCTSARFSGEVYVTDGESGDHAFIRIHWMRSYADSNFVVLNCGGHANRITGARVLYQTSDNTYGTKLLQVYVTTSSNYYVRVHQEGDTPNFGTVDAVTPVVENTKSGYALHGNELTNLDAVSLAAEEGIRVGGTAFINSINSTGGDIQNAKGSYLHLGGWAVGRTHASAVLVNTAYRADYATSLFNENISRFTNDANYLTQDALTSVEEGLRAEINTAQTTADSKLGATAKAVDSDKLDGYDWGQSGKNVRATEFYADNWFRNYNSGEGLFNQATGQHFYSDDDDYWNIAGGTAANGLRFRDNHAGTVRGYVYANSSNQVGFLDAGGTWAIKHVNDSHTEFQDAGEKVFSVGQGGHGSNYGTVSTHGNGRGGWEGYSINERFVWMSSGATLCGMYNDMDNEWMTIWRRNGSTELMHNGAKKLETTANGASVTGTMYATAFSGDGSGLTNIPIPAPSIPAFIFGMENTEMTSVEITDRGEIRFNLANGQAIYLDGIRPSVR